MDDKNKSALVFSLTGALTGVIAGYFFKGAEYSNYLVLMMAIAILILTYYIVPLVGVNTVKLGGRRKVIQGGVFSFLIWWLFWWFLTYNIA
jgi:hypothetical protein